VFDGRAKILFVVVFGFIESAAGAYIEIYARSSLPAFDDVVDRCIEETVEDFNGRMPPPPLVRV